MYAYVFDAALANPKLAKLADRIETKLAELGVGGTVHRLTILKHVDEVITSAIARGAQTIVVVGGESLFHDALSVVAESAAPVALGFIPVGERSPLARYCGIPADVLACHVIANRILVPVDLGRVHRQYFFTHVTIANASVELRCDDRLTLRAPEEVAEVRIINADIASQTHGPQDGLLHAMIPSVKRRGGFWQRAARPTLLPAKNIAVRAREPLPVMLGNKKLSSTPVDITIVPKALRLIVGKDRQF